MSLVPRWGEKPSMTVHHISNTATAHQLQLFYLCPCTTQNHIRVSRKVLPLFFGSRSTSRASTSATTRLVLKSPKNARFSRDSDRKFLSSKPRGTFLLLLQNPENNLVPDGVGKLLRPIGLLWQRPLSVSAVRCKVWFRKM